MNKVAFLEGVKEFFNMKNNEKKEQELKKSRAWAFNSEKDCWEEIFDESFVSGNIEEMTSMIEQPSSRILRWRLRGGTKRGTLIVEADINERQEETGACEVPAISQMVFIFDILEKTVIGAPEIIIDRERDQVGNPLSVLRIIPTIVQDALVARLKEMAALFGVKIPRIPLSAGIEETAFLIIGGLDTVSKRTQIRKTFDSYFEEVTGKVFPGEYDILSIYFGLTPEEKEEVYPLYRRNHNAPVIFSVLKQLELKDVSLCEKLLAREEMLGIPIKYFYKKDRYYACRLVKYYKNINDNLTREEKESLLLSGPSSEPVEIFTAISIIDCWNYYSSIMPESIKEEYFHSIFSQDLLTQMAVIIWKAAANSKILYEECADYIMEIIKREFSEHDNLCSDTIYLDSDEKIKEMVQMNPKTIFLHKAIEEYGCINGLNQGDIDFLLNGTRFEWEEKGFLWPELK